MARLVYVQKLLTMFQGVTILRPLVAYSFIVGNKRQKTLSQAPSFETTINVQVEIRNIYHSKYVSSEQN